MIKLLNKLLGNFGIQVKRNQALLAERLFLDTKYNGAVKIFDVHKKYQNKDLNNLIECMIFSKDRAMQLHALLHSYLQNVVNYCPLTILYKTTNDRSERAYEDLKIEFKEYDIKFLKEIDFKCQVINWFSSAKADRIFFMTDDAVFLAPFDLNVAMYFNPLDTILSLTKGFDLTYCFTHDVKQKVPDFVQKLTYNSDNFNFWKWNSNPDSPDWNYPLSVDGNFFLRDEMLQIAEHISFKNPNSLEASMQIYIDLFANRHGVCFDKARLVNIPCNLVQNTFNNRTTGLFGAEELQDLWDEGKRINFEDFQEMEPGKAVHTKYTFKTK